MALSGSSKKLHGLSKNERLCNFTFKNLLFNQGDSFMVFPIRVHWKLLEKDLEKIFFHDDVREFYPKNELSENHWQSGQNPSCPNRKVPRNAMFSHPAQMLVSVPSRTQKKAVVRNHLKRLIREAYRKNKNIIYPLIDGTDKRLLLGFIYTAKQVLTYDEIEQKIILSLQKLEQKIKAG